MLKMNKSVLIIAVLICLAGVQASGSDWRSAGVRRVYYAILYLFSHVLERFFFNFNFIFIFAPAATIKRKQQVL